MIRLRGIIESSVELLIIVLFVVLIIAIITGGAEIVINVLKYIKLGD